MGIDIGASYNRKELVAVLEENVNERGYTIRQDSIEWQPDNDDAALITFSLRELTPEEKEQMGQDPRSPVEQISDEVQKLCDEIAELKERVEQTRVKAQPEDKEPEEVNDDDSDDTDDAPEKTVRFDTPENQKERQKRIEQIREQNKKKPAPSGANFRTE